jgi:hypothetical protein
MYEGVYIVYDYHYYRMTLQVNIFLYTPEAAKSYLLPKQTSILLLKISMGTRKNFSENYLHLWHALSKRFANPCYNESELH